MFKSSHSDRGTVASAVERGCTHKTSAKDAGFESQPVSPRGDSSIGRTVGFQPVGLGSSPSRRSGA